MYNDTPENVRRAGYLELLYTIYDSCYINKAEGRSATRIKREVECEVGDRELEKRI